MDFFADRYFYWGYDEGKFNTPTKPDSKLHITIPTPTREVGTFKDELYNACYTLRSELAGEQITLSLSGGSDSHVTAHVMKEVGVNFKPIHALVTINNVQINKEETNRARRIAQQLGVELSEIVVPLDKRLEFYTDLVKGNRFVHLYRFIMIDLAMAFKDQLNIAVSGDVIYEALLEPEERFDTVPFRVYDDLRYYSELLGLNMFSGFYKLDPNLYYSLITNPIFFELNKLYSLFRSSTNKFIDKTNTAEEIDYRFCYGNYIKHALVSKEFNGIFNENKVYPIDSYRELYSRLKDQWLRKTQFHPKFNKELDITFSDIIELSKITSGEHKTFTF